MAEFGYKLRLLTHDDIRPPNREFGIRKWGVVGNFAFYWQHLFLPSQLVYGNNDLSRMFKEVGLYDGLDIESDPEQSCSYWYFEKLLHAQLFIKAVNGWLQARQDRLIKEFEELNNDVREKSSDG